MFRCNVVLRLAVSTLIVGAVGWPVKSNSFAQAPSKNQYADAAISDENFALVAAQIRELRNPAFKALLRIRIVSWVAPSDNTARRQAALGVVSEGLSDLCAHQDDVWLPTAWWLHTSLAQAARTLDLAGAEIIIGRCSIKRDESDSDAARDLNAALKMLGSPAQAAAGVEKAKAAIITGHVRAESLLGDLLQVQKTNPEALIELLSATAFSEEQHPGVIPLRLTPFFIDLFLEKSNPAELQSRFLSAAIRSTRVSPEELKDPIVKSQVLTTLRGIAEPTKKFAPALYPELATRLNANFNVRYELQAAEERIRTSNDQLAQIESEADQTSDKVYKRELLVRGAQLALARKMLRKAVDLAVAARAEQSWASSRDTDLFLGKIARVAVDEKQPEAAVYAIPRTENPLIKANGWFLLGNYYANRAEMERSGAALDEAARLIKQVDNNSDKLKLSVAIAQSVVVWSPATSYDAFQQVVDIINKLPAPDKDKKKMYFLSLPVEEMIKAFRLLAANDRAQAMAFTQEIKLPELRIAALSGACSTLRTAAAQIK